MAWIASDQALRNHPKVKRAARALGISKVAMIGHLHCLWWWALDYAQDGDVSAFAAADIAEAAEWDGDYGDSDFFVCALTDAARIGDGMGFLERTPDGGLVIHDWWDYAGKLIDKRRADAERKRAARHPLDAPEQERGKTPDDNVLSAGHPTDIAKTSAGHLVDVAGRVQYSREPYLTNPKLEDDAELTPEQRAIQNAYDACGLMMSKTHLDAHLLTIKQAGLVNWQLGWAKAMEAGKQNMPAYVARCAESAMLAAQRGNGNNKGQSVPATAEERKAKYASGEYANIVES